MMFQRSIHCCNTVSSKKRRNIVRNLHSVRTEKLKIKFELQLNFLANIMHIFPNQVLINDTRVSRYYNARGSFIFIV